MGDTQPEPCVGSIEKAGTIPTTQIDAILTLETACRHDEARIGNVWPVSGYFVFTGRTVVSGGSGGAEAGERQYDDYPKSRASILHQAAYGSLRAF